MKITKKLKLTALLMFALSCATVQAQSEPGMVGSAEEAESVLESRSEFMKGIGQCHEGVFEFSQEGRRRATGIGCHGCRNCGKRTRNT